MSLDNPQPGHGSVPEYLVPGVPWLTQSTIPSGQAIEFELPYVTSAVHVMCLSGSVGTLMFGVTRAGVLASNRLPIAPGTSADLRIRTKTLVFGAPSGNADFAVCAGLTRITASFFPKYDHSKTAGV